MKRTMILGTTLLGIFAFASASYAVIDDFGFVGVGVPNGVGVANVIQTGPVDSVPLDLVGVGVPNGVAAVGTVNVSIIDGVPFGTTSIILVDASVVQPAATYVL